jgi:hypothetical protein
MKIPRFCAFICLFIISGALLSACAPSPSTAISVEDKAEIYAAVIKKLYGVEKGVVPDSFKTLYIAQTTKDSVTSETPQTPAVLSAEDQQKIAQKLQELPAKIIWVNAYEDIPWDRDKGLVKDGGAGVTLGKIAFQTDGKLQVPGGIYYGSLGAHGATYVVEKIDGKWTVTGLSGGEWMS